MSYDGVTKGIWQSGGARNHQRLFDSRRKARGTINHHKSDLINQRRSAFSQTLNCQHTV